MLRWRVEHPPAPAGRAELLDLLQRPALHGGDERNPVAALRVIDVLDDVEYASSFATGRTVSVTVTVLVVRFDGSFALYVKVSVPEKPLFAV